MTIEYWEHILEILVDNQQINAQPDKEKTILDVINAITEWLNQNNRIAIQSKLNGVDINKIDSNELQKNLTANWSLKLFHLMNR